MNGHPESLQAWRTARALCTTVCDFTGEFPPEQRFQIAAEMRQMAAAIPADIARGTCLEGSAEFADVLKAAVATLCQLESRLQLCDYLALGEAGNCQVAMQIARRLQHELADLSGVLAGMAWGDTAPPFPKNSVPR